MRYTAKSGESSIEVSWRQVVYPELIFVVGNNCRVTHDNDKLTYYRGEQTFEIGRMPIYNLQVKHTPFFIGM